MVRSRVWTNQARTGIHHRSRAHQKHKCSGPRADASDPRYHPSACGATPWNRLGPTPNPARHFDPADHVPETGAGPGGGARPPERLASRLVRWLENDVRAAGLLAVVALAGCAATGAVSGLPLPGNHDQFSYLLAADTFASGRLANATHPMWRFFETFHVIHQPTYVSKYPPGQGLILAFGQGIFGHPAWGVWLSSAFLSAAAFWAARGWIPRPWALVAGAMVTIQLGFTSYWAQSYWGGNVAAAGGALLFGVLPRIVERPSPRMGAVLAVSLVILANSRPLEGLIASGVAAFYLIGRLRPEDAVMAHLRRTGPAFVLCLAVGTGMTMRYNERTTGAPTLMPYQVHEATYSMSSLIPGSEPNEREYNHDVIRRYHEIERASREYTHGLEGFLVLGGRKLVRLGAFFLGFFGLPALIGVPALLREDRNKWALVAAVGAVIGATMFTVGFPHYLAPVAVPIYVLMAGALGQLFERRRHSNRALTIFKVTAILLASTAIARSALVFIPSPPGFAQQRQSLLAQLEGDAGLDLVFVRYGSYHNLDFEWVYNRADIDAASVVWAHDMGSENQALMDYYPDRRAWMLHAGSEPTTPGQLEHIELTPYPENSP